MRSCSCPGARRLSMCALYAFLRRTDDLADEPGSAREIPGLDGWRRELDAGARRRGARPGRVFPPWPTPWRGTGSRADLLHEVIEGVSMDVEPLRLRDLRRAGGLLPSRRLGRRPVLPPYLGLSIGGGQGRAAGRTLRHRAATDEHHPRRPRRRTQRPDLSARGRPGAFRRGAGELSAAGPAERPRPRAPGFRGSASLSSFTTAAAPLAPLVAPVGRPVLLTIVGIYRALLDEMARRDYNVFEGRIAISRWSKLLITARALATRRVGRKPASPRAPDLKTAHDWIAPPR